MTSPYDDGGSARPPHASVDELADIAGGSTVEVQISAHVDSCAECRQRLTDVVAGSAAVSAELAALPTPPMPLDLVRRIEDAIAAERAPTTSEIPAEPVVPTPSVEPPAEPPAVQPTPTSGPGTVVAMAERQSFWRRHGGAVASSVAASVIIALVAVLLVGHFRDNNKSDSTTASAAKADTGIVTTSGVDYNTKNLGAALPSLLKHQAPGGAIELAPSGQLATGGTATDGQGSGTTGGTSGSPSAPVPPQRTTTSNQFKQATSLPANLVALKTDPLALQQCLVNLQTPLPPLAVDLGLWNSQPAAVFVFAVANHPDLVEVFITPAGCPPGEVLVYQRFAKPKP